MSVVCETKNGYVICHERFVRNVYDKVEWNGRQTHVALNKKVFDIREPFKTSSPNLNEQTFAPCVNDLTSEGYDPTTNASKTKRTKKRKRKREFKSEEEEEDVNRLQVEINHVKRTLPELVESGRLTRHFCAKNSAKDVGDVGKTAKEFADNVYEETALKPLLPSNGGNVEDSSVVVQINDSSYLIPPRCKFYCHNVLDLRTRLVPLNEKFDFVVLDPPWWNKYVRRKKAKHVEASYKMLYNKDLAELPLSLLTARGALVAVWCTNAPSHRKALMEECFPAWGLTFVGKWYWLKVTTSGEPVCSFMPPLCKQPFEQIYFGVSEGREELELETPSDSKIVASVPSAVHSHKPPLADVLAPYLPSNPRCLELFARYLLPGWVSYGNEVLRLQDTSLYEEVG